MWLYDRTIRDGKIFSGLICRESASYYHGLSNYPPSPVQIYTTYKNRIDTPYVSYIPIEEISYEDSIAISSHCSVTNQERTICELIEYESNEEYIYQSLESYLDIHDQKILLECAEKRKSREKVQYFIDTLDKYLEELYY